MARLLRAFILAVCLTVALTQHDRSASNEVLFDVTGGALVTSTIGLHAALSPKVVPFIERITVVNDVVLDPLSLVPLLSVNSSLSICGSAPEVRLSVAAPIEAFVCNSMLTLCSLTIEVVFPLRGGLETAWFTATPFADVLFRDVTFFVDPGTFSRLEANLTDIGTVKGFNALTNVTGDAGPSTGPLVRLENVTIRAEEKQLTEVTGTSVTQPDHFDSLMQSAARGDAPVEVIVSGNFTVSQCLLDKINEGNPVNILRPLTLRAGPGGAWLSFEPGLAVTGFFRVVDQLRMVGLNLLTETEESEELRTSPLSFMFDTRQRGCRVVGVDVVMVKPCSVVNELATLRLLRRSSVDLLDLTAIDSRTVRLNRYSSNGECYRNSIVTCREGIVGQNLQSADCRGSR